MDWIKKNSGFVAAATVSAILLVVAAVFLLNQMGANSAADERLSELLGKRLQLWSSPLHPEGLGDTNNQDLATKDRIRLVGLLDRMKSVVPPMPAPSVIDDQSFKNLLERSLFEMNASVTNLGIIVPDRFSYSFAPVRSQFKFNSNSVAPLVLQLGDITNLVGRLVSVRVSAINAIRRVPLTLEDRAAVGSGDHLGLSAKTNEFVISLPYEVSFIAFGSELESLINGFASSTDCVVVKNVDVSQAGPLPTLAGIQVGVSPESYGRQGFSRYSRGQMLPNGLPPSGSTQPETVLDSQPLRVTLLLEIVRSVTSAAKENGNP